MAGYAHRVVTIHFPDLAEEGDDVFVVLRNPKTVALSKLDTSQALATNEDGTVIEADAAAAGYKLLARLIIGGRLYDATMDEVDCDGNPLDQPLLTYPLSVEQAMTLPVDIINGIFKRINEAQNPH